MPNICTVQEQMKRIIRKHMITNPLHVVSILFGILLFHVVVVVAVLSLSQSFTTSRILFAHDYFAWAMIHDRNNIMSTSFCHNKLAHLSLAKTETQKESFVHRKICCCYKECSYIYSLWNGVCFFPWKTKTKFFCYSNGTYQRLWLRVVVKHSLLQGNQNEQKKQMHQRTNSKSKTTSSRRRKNK